MLCALQRQPRQQCGWGWLPAARRRRQAHPRGCCSRPVVAAWLQTLRALCRLHRPAASRQPPPCWLHWRMTPTWSPGPCRRMVRSASDPVCGCETWKEAAIEDARYAAQVLAAAGAQLAAEQIAPCRCSRSGQEQWKWESGAKHRFQGLN